MKPMRLLSVLIVGISSLGLIAGVGLFVGGGVINTSKSIARGLYWKVSLPVAKGEYVIFCPPQRNVFAEAKSRGYIGSGFCPGGYGYMMKKVLAAKGDNVEFTNQGVFVNKKLLLNTKPLTVDFAKRPLPRIRQSFTLNASDVLLMTDHSSTSFDARYFGVVTTNQVQSVIRPIFTWN